MDAYDDEEHLPHVRLSDLERCTRLESLTLRVLGLETGIIDVKELPTTLKHLKVTWHMHSETFWKPKRRRCAWPPVLEVICTPDWIFLGPDGMDEYATVMSLKSEYASVFALSWYYETVGQVTKHGKLMEWWTTCLKQHLPGPLWDTFVQFVIELWESWPGFKDLKDLDCLEAEEAEGANALPSTLSARSALKALDLAMQHLSDI